MAFCKFCNREVGVHQPGPGCLFWIFIILGLIIPFWIITLPVCWIVALSLWLFGRKSVCGICKGPL